VIGIDVAKHTVSVCAWDQEREQVRWEREFANSPAGVEALLAQTPPEEPWVLEPTGCYGAALVHLAAAEGRMVLAADPRAAKYYLQSLHPRAKVDRLDAQGLARYASTHRLRCYRLQDPHLQRLWELLCVRCQLGRAVAALCLQRQVFSRTRGETSTLLATLREQLKALEAQLRQEGRQVALFRRLLAIPGVGVMTAAALTVRLSAIHFVSPHQFVAYVGLDLRVIDSGERRGQRKLTKHGDGMLRWLLYMAAKASLKVKKECYFRELYERKCAEGWPRTGALCMVARKIAKIAWALAHSGQSYRPERVANQHAT
jgi:transposase